MEIVYLLCACTFFALQFVFQKMFEKHTAKGLAVCLWNLLVCSTVSMVFLVLKMGTLSVTVNNSALIYVVLYAAGVVLGTVVTIAAMSSGNVGMVGTYSLAGGMIVPYLYGILVLHEPAGKPKPLPMCFAISARTP